MTKKNYGPLFVFFGMVLIAGAIVMFVIEPKILDELGVNLGTTCGQSVTFELVVNRGQLADPYMASVKANDKLINNLPAPCGCGLYGCGCNAGFSISDLHSKVQIKIGDFKTIETSEAILPRFGGTQVVTSASQPIPCGTYNVTFMIKNIGGLCIPVISPCEWTPDGNNIITKTLTVSKSGVTLT